MESVQISYSGTGKNSANLSPKDSRLVVTNLINSSFGAQNEYIELFVYGENGELIAEDYDASDYYPDLINNQQNNTYSKLTLNPETDLRNRGFNRGTLNTQYNFYKRLFNSSFGRFYWIKQISPSRTEIKLASQTISDNIINSGFQSYRTAASSVNYYPVFFLNFGGNQLAMANNALYGEDEQGGYLLIKLYEPLPSQFGLKTQLWIVEKIAESVSYNVKFAVESDPVITLNSLRGPNFNVTINTKNGQTTPYYNYNNLLLSPVTSSYQKLKSFYQDKSIDLNIDYSNFSNFVHFSSAVQRVNNFVYKLQQIESAEANIAYQQSIISGSVSVVSSSISVEQQFIDNVIKNFDIYEYFLYFNSSSWAWPKSNSTQPYSLYSVTSSQALSFLGSETTVPNATTASILFSASYYDSTNKDTLRQSIPQYLLDDPANQSYVTFMDMMGQHFDNIWVYYKDVSNRYNATNNPNTGISLDLVSDALRGLGMQLYTNTNVSDNLYYTMFGINPDGSLLPPTGSEWITNYVTSSLATLPAETLQDEIYKRLYHNLPYLLKTKGTARGIKSLIQIYGIPESMLKVREFGGNPYDLVNGVIDVDTTDYKITIDTGSFNIPTFVTSEILEYIQSEDDSFVITDEPVFQGSVTGSLTISSSLLSPYTTLQYYVGNRRLNNTNVEVGFSPADTINAEISASQGTFVIDQLIGSPGYRYSSSYEPLVSASNAYFSSYTQPNSIWEYVRLLKFYNNSLFKVIKDFVPARANVSTGIIIKSHLYERNKYARNEPSMSVELYSQSIDMISISGSEGGALIGETDWSGFVMSPNGPVYYESTDDIEKYTGELSGSYLRVTSGRAFPQTEISQRPAPFLYNEVFISESGDYIVGESSGPPPSPDPENAFVITEDQLGNPYYVTQLYALYQNVTGSVKSQVLLDLDYNSDQQKPVNYGAITYSINQYQVDNYATYTNPNNPYAQVQDYNYNLQRSLIPRYSGSKTVSSTYNEYTEGDQSYGKTAAIDKIKYQYAYLVDIFSSSFQLPGRTKAQIKYIIDNNQNVLDLSKTNTNIFTVQNVFKSSEWVDVSLFDYDPNNPHINRLNNSEKDFTIWESGYIYSPLLFNISGTSLTYNYVIPSSSTSTVNIPSYVNLNPGDTNYWTINSPITAFTAPSAPYTAGRFGITGSAVQGGSPGSGLAVLINFTITNTLRGGTFSGQFTIPAGTSPSYRIAFSTSPYATPYNTWLVSDGLTITTTQQSYNPSGGTSTSTAYITSITDPSPFLIIEDEQSILLSATQSYNYGNIILNATQSGMEAAVFPLEINRMDLIRLYNTSSGFTRDSEYRVKRVIDDYQSGSLNYVKLVLDRPINSSDASGSVIPGRSTRYIILKRIPDETAVTFNYDLPQPITNDGILFPEYIDKNVRDNSGNVIKALKQQNLI